MKAHPCPDWRVTATACQLGKTLWYARAEAYQLDEQAWEAQPPAVKQFYVTRAVDVLQALMPGKTESPYFDLAVAITKAHAAKVIGRIDPQTLWGDAVFDPRD